MVEYEYIYIYGVALYNLCFVVGLPIAVANEIGYTQGNGMINKHN